MNIGNYEISNQELKKIKKKIKGKVVVLQLPEALKPHFSSLVRYFNNAKEIFVWLGSCYGSCDLPRLPFRATILQFGHNLVKIKDKNKTKNKKNKKNKRQK